MCTWCPCRTPNALYPFLGRVLRVQQMVRAVAQRLAEELGVELLHVGVLVRLAELLALVLAIDGRDAGLADAVVGEPRLPTAADAAAGTGHDLDEMIAGLAPLHGLDQPLGVAQPVGHGHVQRHAFQETPLGHAPSIFERRPPSRP